LRSYRDAVKAEIRGLMALAGAAVPDVEAELDRQLEFLLHEWFASRRAANAFGRPQTNAQAASGYSAVVAVRVKSLGSPPADNRTWKLRVLQLGQAVTAWFDATAIPEMTPRGGRVGPIITVEPPILRL
jgi:hypothetical protein